MIGVECCSAAWTFGSGVIVVTFDAFSTCCLIGDMAKIVENTTSFAADCAFLLPYTIVVYFYDLHFTKLHCTTCGH